MNDRRKTMRERRARQKARNQALVKLREEYAQDADIQPLLETLEVARQMHREAEAAHRETKQALQRAVQQVNQKLEPFLPEELRS